MMVLGRTPLCLHDQRNSLCALPKLSHGTRFPRIAQWYLKTGLLEAPCPESCNHWTCCLTSWKLIFYVWKIGNHFLGPFGRFQRLCVGFAKCLGNRKWISSYSYCHSYYCFYWLKEVFAPIKMQHYTWVLTACLFQMLIDSRSIKDLERSVPQSLDVTVFEALSEDSQLFLVFFQRPYLCKRTLGSSPCVPYPAHKFLLWHRYLMLRLLRSAWYIQSCCLGTVICFSYG